MTLRDPSVFEVEGRDGQSEWLTVTERDDDGRVTVSLSEARVSPSDLTLEIDLTMIQTVELAIWLGRPAINRLLRAATKAAYEGGMPDSGVRSELLAALDEALG